MQTKETKETKAKENQEVKLNLRHLRMLSEAEPMLEEGKIKLYWHGTAVMELETERAWELALAVDNFSDKLAHTANTIQSEVIRSAEEK